MVQVKSQTAGIDEMLKSLVCPKIDVAHMERNIYDPSCLAYCRDLCGTRCRKMCNNNHSDCARGKLPVKFLNCPTVASNAENISLGFVTYESVDVDTFGKGKSYKRVEKITREYSYNEYLGLLEDEFQMYAEHTLTSWFLRATKMEAFAPTKARSTTVTITSDFGEAIQIVGKSETSNQFFHRPEVMIVISTFCA